MPSLLEHLENDDPSHVPVSAPLGMIDAVKAEGARRRTFRHRRNLAGAVLAVGLLALPAAALRAGDSDGDQPQEVAVATDAGDTIPDIPSDSLPPLAPGDPVVAEATAPTTVPPAAAPTSTLAPLASTAPATVQPRSVPATTVTTVNQGAPPLVCRNSDNPDCGPFHWDPALGPNQPLVASFTKAPTEAVVGQTVTFEVSWSDPDAKLTFDRLSTDGSRIGTSCMLVPRYGPWTPPSPEGGSGTRSYPTAFSAPGSYEVVVELGTSIPGAPVNPDCSHPYGNETRLVSTINVAPAP